MLRFLLLVLLAGCVHKNDLKPSDTNFNENQRNWLEVYRNEIKVAVENDDVDAYNFFFEQYMRERIKIFREQKNLDK